MGQSVVKSCAGTPTGTPSPVWYRTVPDLGFVPFPLIKLMALLGPYTYRPGADPGFCNWGGGGGGGGGLDVGLC